MLKNLHDVLFERSPDPAEPKFIIEYLLSKILRRNILGIENVLPEEPIVPVLMSTIE